MQHNFYDSRSDVINSDFSFFIYRTEERVIVTEPQKTEDISTRNGTCEIYFNPSEVKESNSLDSYSQT